MSFSSELCTTDLESTIFMANWLLFAFSIAGIIFLQRYRVSRNNELNNWLELLTPIDVLFSKRNVESKAHPIRYVVVVLVSATIALTIYSSVGGICAG
ncbi:MAG: hypothetical protein GY928_30615 [Colwellia sp.]|nr:hypothetical protein [Colwellia sp.]